MERGWAGQSPFVRVFEIVGIPAAAGVMNFVVLTAALSSVNCNLYLMSRMLFSLSRGGYAPSVLGRLSRARYADSGVVGLQCGNDSSARRGLFFTH